MSTKASKSSMEPPIGAATNAAPIGGGSAINEKPVTQNVGQAPSFYEIITGMKSSSRLDPAAMEYIKQLDQIFADCHAGITSIPISSDKIEGRAYKKTGTDDYIVIIFADTNQTIDNVPAALRVLDVKKILEVADRTGQLRQSIVVTKEDYAKAPVMAAFIMNAFMTISGTAAANMTVDSLRDLRIVANTNLEMVRDYVRRNSPHAVPARDDYGVLLCLERTEANPTNRMNEKTLTPFMAITGYTRIMNPEVAPTGRRFVPIPTITDIVSAIPNNNLLSMALPIAAEAFIMIGLWSRPYATFRAGQPNLGNLISDAATKKPLFTDTPETLAAFINTNMTNPFLAIDITEGRARPVGIDQFIGDASRQAIVANIHRFLKFDQIAAEESRAVMIFSNFTGTYIDNGQIKDTRCVDYLDLAAKVTNHNDIKHFLLQPNQPQARIDAVRAIHPDVTKSLYCTTTIVLDSSLVVAMSQGLRNAKVNIAFDTPINGMVNLTQLMTSTANNFNMLGQFSQGFRPIGFDPTMCASLYGTPLYTH